MSSSDLIPSGLRRPPAYVLAAAAASGGGVVVVVCRAPSEARAVRTKKNIDLLPVIFQLSAFHVLFVMPSIPLELFPVVAKF